jgi:RNA polymerase sigma-70 factor, ECF subfamily
MSRPRLAPPTRTPGPRQSDLEPLLHAIAEGDSDALQRFYDLTSPWVFRLALRLLSDRQLAEEATLDVFFQAWKRARDYDRSRGHVATWLLTMTRSRALDLMRFRAVRCLREEDLSADLTQRLCASVDQSDPTRPRGAFERDQLVHAAIAELPSDQRRAIELAYFPGLSHTEIAERLGEPLGTVKTRIRLGMLKLREKLRPLEDQP